MLIFLMSKFLNRRVFSGYLERKLVTGICIKNSLIRNKSSTSTVNTVKQSILCGFNAEQSERILETINKTSREDLLCFNISKTRASKLYAWRMENGALKRLEDIFQVEGFAYKTAKKFYKSLLEKPKTTKSTKPDIRSRTASFVTPSIDEEFLSKIRSCLSIRVGVASITWARLELANSTNTADPCILTHWQHYDIEKRKLHLHELIQHSLYVHDSMPLADCYVFESPQMAQANNIPGNADQQNVNINRAQMTAIFSYALAARPKTIVDAHTHVYYLRRFLTARLFSTLIGTERVSSEDTVLRLMRIFYNNNDYHEHDHVENDYDNSVENKENEPDLNSDLSLRDSVQFPMEFRQLFSRSERTQREFLGQVLLLNLAFVRLVLLQDATSISAVTRGNSNKLKKNIPD